MNLFDRLPENFFSVLARKYKAVYAYALVTLFQTLKTYKSKIRKSDYINELRAHGEDILKLFDVELDKLDDKDDEEKIPYEPGDSVISGKINYVFRKLVATGWIDVEKDLSTNVEYLYLPSYSIRFLKLISDLSSDTSLYVPLVHQTYSEISLENEKEDDYMFRSLVAARENAEELELNVTLLHHSICVFGHSLSSVFDPNEVLHQHFDVFQTEVGSKVYHPMKTYDSLSLYSLPIIQILTRWQHDPRLMAKLVSQAKYDVRYQKSKTSDVAKDINRMLQETIDIFSKLSDAFEDIDKANAQYTKAVQKKVNYLSSGDKSIRGKLKAIILQISKDLNKADITSETDLDKVQLIQDASATIAIYHQGFVNSDCLTMPFKRGERGEDEPLPLDDAIDFVDDPDFDQMLIEQNRFSEEAIENFMLKNFGNRKSITTEDIELRNDDDLILLILAVVRAEFNDMFYTITKIKDQVRKGHFLLPCYQFVRKGKGA